MRILRTGGQFTDSRIHAYCSETTIWFLTAALLLGVSRYLGFGWPGLAGSVLLFVLGTKSFDRWQRWFLGKRGEIRVTEALRYLPEDYVLVNDLMLPDGRGNVDHFLIGPNGLFVIETKNYSGQVRCEGDEWFVNGHRSKSLSRQAKRNAMAVRRNLESLFSEQRQKLPFIVAVLVFVKYTGLLHLHQATIPVLKAEDLADFIRNYNSNTRITEEQCRAIVRHLQYLQLDQTQSKRASRQLSTDPEEPLCKTGPMQW